MAQFHFTPDDYLELMHREVPQEKQQSALGIQRRQTVEAKFETQAPSGAPGFRVSRSS